jgi:predicted ArsR family transcriptional regulator
MIGKRVSPESVARMIGLLVKDSPISMKELAERSGIALATARRWMARFRQEGLVHVSAWDHDGRKFHAVFSWGSGRDARQPKLGRTEIQRRYRKKSAMLEMMHALAGPLEGAR